MVVERKGRMDKIELGNMQKRRREGRCMSTSVRCDVGSFKKTDAHHTSRSGEARLPEQLVPATSESHAMRSCERTIVGSSSLLAIRSLAFAL